MKRKYFQPSERRKRARWTAKAERDLKGALSKLPSQRWSDVSPTFSSTREATILGFINLRAIRRLQIYSDVAVVE